MAIYHDIRREWTIGPLAAAVALMLAPGCGGESGPPRLPVSGRVTLDGQPVPSGGDVITEIDGRPIEGMEDVISQVNSMHAGEELRLTVVRGGEERELTVTLGERPAEIEDPAAQVPALP
jgi:S1-C subfamily serine protease